MKLQFYAHLRAEHLLHSAGLLQEISTSLEAIPIPVWAGKSKANSSLYVVQQVLNSFIEYQLATRGWLTQAQVGARATEFYADFWKSSTPQWDDSRCEVSPIKALCEVQFGNVARIGMDLEKFRIGNMQGRCDVAIEVVPMKGLADRIDDSVATFEKAKSLVEALGPWALPVPLLLVGLSDDPLQPHLNLKSHFRNISQLKGVRSAVVRQAFARSVLSPLWGPNEPL
ncbi:hypothetical protein LC612_33570 [Nostoc sp. CHAB 5834]|nr:hypothetical protein [Nostoc sp. CHAB 5834]